MMAAMRTILLTIIFPACLFLAMRPTDLGAETVPSSVRYGIRSDTKLYPQSTPRESLASVVKAIQSDDVAYLLAQLVWPTEVDQKFGGQRKRLIALADKGTPEKRRKMAEAIEQHLKSGTWTIQADNARSTVTGLPDVTLSRSGDRWFMHNVPGQN